MDALMDVTRIAMKQELIVREKPGLVPGFFTAAAGGVECYRMFASPIPRGASLARGTIAFCASMRAP